MWALPTPGGPDDFPRLVRLIAAGSSSRASSRASRALWAIRWKLGERLGWDDEPDVGKPTIRDRLPADLSGGPDFESLPFRPLYLLDDEFAAEIANATVHAILHLGWVPDGAAYRGEMAVYVKPNGRLGRVYMPAIRPFRHLIVYPAMLRDLERGWQSPAAGPR